MADAGDFSLIVTAVDSAKLTEASQAFARAFSLDTVIAQQICKSAPIIFAQKLTKAEVKAITPSLTKLSGGGMEFRVTMRVATKLPKVNWPSRPQFTAGGSAAVNGLAFEWDNNAFVCPSCNETFLFRRLGKLSFTEGGSAPVVTAAAPMDDFGVEEAPPSPQVTGVEGVEPLAGEGESLDLADSVEEVNPDDLAPEEPVEEITLDDMEPAAQEVIPVDEPVVEEIGDFAEEVEEPQVAEPEPPPAPVDEGIAAEGEDAYNVFLSKITDGGKREKAATLIAGVKGCSPGEAKELTSRLVIPLAKNVTKKRAEEILAQFKKLKIFGRMTKVK